MSDIKWNQQEFELLWKEKESWKQEDGTYICPICNRKCENFTIKRHLKRHHFDFKHKVKIARKMSDETKRKISASVKKACQEGRLNNWQNKRKNTPSYPEQFFMQVIENEFTDKNYVYEYTFSKYSLDFAWPHLKKCIEIDGDQHYQFIERINTDIEKNLFLIKNGWKFIRIRWKDIFNESQKWINIAKDFIEEDINNLEDNLEKYRKELEEKEKIKIQKEIDKYHEIALKINEIIDAKIDFSKWGSIQKASKIIGITAQKTRKWLERNGAIE